MGRDHRSDHRSDQEALISALVKLVLHQEETMNALLLEMFTQTGHGGLVDTLIEISAEYHHRVDNTMQMAKTPARMIMATCFCKETGTPILPGHRQRTAQGGCQNYGLFLDTHYNTAPNI